MKNSKTGDLAADNHVVSELTLADLPMTSAKFPSFSCNPPLTPTPKSNSFFRGLRHPEIMIDVFDARNFWKGASQVVPAGQHPID